MTTEKDVPFDAPTDPVVSPPPRSVVKPMANGTHPEESFESAAPVRIVPAMGAVGRTLPHSLEAEEYLLSCCLLDGADVVARCLEARIRPESFYDSRHGLIYEQLLDLQARGQVIDISVLAEELKTRRLLDQVGGYAFLTQVSSRIPTTAQAGYFIEKVRELALLREIIRSATGTVEDCYGFTGGIDDFITEIAVRGQRLAEQRSPGFEVLQRLEAAVYDPRRRLPEIEPVFHLGKVPICTRGNLTTITAVTKVGKSSFVAGVLAATFRDPDHGGDTFTVRSQNPDGHAVIHFDTEQHGKHHERMMDAVCRRAGADLPSWLYSYSRKGASALQLRQELEVVLKAKTKFHGGIHSVHLDGIADFAADVNDAKECNPLVSWLEGLTVTYDCPIVCVLHLNPISNRDTMQKSRGHLGSQLQRKCETDLRLKKDDQDTTVVFTDPQGTRGQPVFEKDGVRFRWDPDEQMHITSRARGPDREAQNLAVLQEVASEAFAHAKTQSLRYGDLIKAIEVSAGVTSKRAEGRFSEMKKAQVLTKDLLGFWKFPTTK